MLRRMGGMILGYAVAVMVASTLCCAIFAAVGFIMKPSTLSGLFPTVIVTGTMITASTAWPGYMLTTWLLLSKRLTNTPLIMALAGALTAVQALLLMSFFVETLAHIDIWIPAVIGGATGAFAFSMIAEKLFGMTFKTPVMLP